jgi:hypothetical protein
MLIFKTNQGEKSLKAHKGISERGFPLLSGTGFKKWGFALAILTARIY